jgi:hypothetical protein
MNKTAIAVAGAGLGAAAMYVFDPSRGRHRRARLADAASHVSHRAQAIAGMTARDVQHRVSGVAARALGQLLEEGSPSDEVLVERVRARLGRLVSHPGAIDVLASGGTVTLAGPVFEAEVDQLVEGVTAVAGVIAVQNELEPHRDAAHVSALQGPGPRTIRSPSAASLRWTPTARLLAAMAGLALLSLSSTRHSDRRSTSDLADASS